MKNLQLLAVLFAVTLFASCATMTGFEEGKTLGEDNMEFGVSANVTSAPDILGDDADVDEFIAFPNIELGVKYGITEEFDLGIRVNSNLNLGAFMKYQIIGDKNSAFAVSPGLEFATFAALTYAVQVPLYMSIYPNQNLAININPRAVYQTSAGAALTGGVSYLGGNVGFLYGKKHKFGLDIGYYSVGVDGSRTELVNVGIGGRFRFGDLFETGSSDDSGNRRRRR